MLGEQRTLTRSGSIDTLDDLIVARLDTLEQRLNESDSFFRVSSESSKIQQQKRKEVSKQLMETLKELDSVANSAEEKMSDLAGLIKKLTLEQLHEYETDKKAFEMNHYEDCLGAFEESFNERQKHCKELTDQLETELVRLKNGEGDIKAVEALLDQLDEIQSQQRQIVASFIEAPDKLPGL